MKRILSITVITALTLGVGWAQTNKRPTKTPKPAASTASARHAVMLRNVKGEDVGNANLSETATGVDIFLNLHGLPPGEHAVHIHQVAKCEADPAAPQDAFKSAGPHFNPTAKKHGLQNPEGPHAGDLPNFSVGPTGTARTKVSNPRVTLDPAAPNSVFAGGGTALIIHAKADDLKTDPAGNAGDRIACGLIKKE